MTKQPETRSNLPYFKDC